MWLAKVKCISMKMKICFFIIVLLSFRNTIAQQTINILECRYSMVRVTGNDTIKMNDKIVRISSDKIVFWDHRDGNIILSYICDFNKSLQSSFLISNGSKHDFRLEDERKKAELIYKTKTIGNIASNAKLCLPEDVSTNPFNNQQSSVFDTLYVDTTIKIAHYLKGGFRDFFGNGVGFLPIKTVRKIMMDSDLNGYTIVTQLVSKKEVIFTEEEWAKMLNNN